MEGNKSSFCTSCGAPLRDSDTFCMTCGYKAGGGDGSSQAASRDAQQGLLKRSGRLWVIFALAVIWAAFAIYYGQWYFLNAGPMVDEAFAANSSLWDIISDSDYQLLKNVISAVGIVLLISGIAALMSAVLILIKRLHTVALILCIIGSALALIMIIPGIIGLISAYFLHQSKHEFVPFNK